MKIIAFLQTNAFNISHGKGFLPEMNAAYMKPDQWRSYLLKTKYGGMLEKAFTDLYDKILWRHAHPYPSEKPGAKLEYSTQYIRETIKAYAPDLILCFGESAAKGVNESIHNIPYSFQVMYINHSGETEFKNVLFELAVFSGQVRQRIDELNKL